jgi:hypothetical protein
MQHADLPWHSCNTQVKPLGTGLEHALAANFIACNMPAAVSRHQRSTTISSIIIM